MWIYVSHYTIGLLEMLGSTDPCRVPTWPWSKSQDTEGSMGLNDMTITWKTCEFDAPRKMPWVSQIVKGRVEANLGKKKQWNLL